MRVVEATNVNMALTGGLTMLLMHGVQENSRNGPVLVAPWPVVTQYYCPMERVLFSPLRDANPFFHLMEALWMMAGKSDVNWPSYFNSSIYKFSDDGDDFHGAYGRRWRSWFGYDQLLDIAHELRTKPESRRCVLTMWDAGMRHETKLPYREHEASDLHIAMSGGKDVPCNTHIYFMIVAGKLNITVCCRSNDAIWGAYGANAVHFSILQEVMAAMVGVPVGVYYQLSNNFHAYTEVFSTSKMWELVRDGIANDHYAGSLVGNDRAVIPIVNPMASWQSWFENLEQFLQFPYSLGDYSHPFFNTVAVPMYHSWADRKQKVNDGWDWATKIQAGDWQIACTEWIARRNSKAATTAETRPTKES